MSHASELEIKAAEAVVDIADRMTSELVYLSATPEDIYGIEHARRLGLLGLSEEQVRASYQSEKRILTENHNKRREKLWAYVCKPPLTPETLTKSEGMTLSELIARTDDANFAFAFLYERTEIQKLQEAIFTAASEGGCKAIYANAFYQRIREIGWSRKQGDAYTRNECLLMERLKWKMHQKQAWTKETTAPTSA